jgi:hypothetical protein
MALSVIFEPVLHGSKAKVTPYWLVLFSVTAIPQLEEIRILYIISILARKSAVLGRIIKSTLATEARTQNNYNHTIKSCTLQQFYQVFK